MDSERKAIFQKARRLLANAKAQRADVLADIERRQLEDHQSLPPLLVDRSQPLVHKRFEIPSRDEQPVTAASTDYSQEWCGWVRNEFLGMLRVFAEEAGDGMADTNSWLIGKIMDRVEAKEMALEAEIDALGAEIKKLREQLNQTNNVKQIRGPNAA